MAPSDAAAVEDSRILSFRRRIDNLSLAPLWEHARELLPPEPRPSAVPFVWGYEAVRSALDEASATMTTEDAERRVLLLRNPGLDPLLATTPTLLAGVQMLLPGEVALAHRHTAAAVRFVVEGTGAYTVTDGERTQMAPGDLVMTPSWTWHDHENEGAEPVLWLDGLDVPLVRALETGFFELHPQPRQPVTKPVDDSKRRFVHATLLPRGGHPSASTPVVSYPWAVTERALLAGADDPALRSTMVTLDYVNPLSGGAVTPTLGCRAHLLRPGGTTLPRRETSSSIFHVVRGAGTSIVDGTALAWSEKDVFAVPGWAEVAHTNASPSEPALLFSLTDEPAIRALGMYRSAGAPAC
ncbi:MAG TPA: cupin domain-containing protein [Acidimicrobiales bacterium]|nr:cupin domain-containing protein [Acidimicrobiales bacterium]